MAFLFVVENNRAKPNVETLLIEPFKGIWEGDDSADKREAIKVFTYIEFMTSKKKSNPYAGYNDLDRHGRLVEDLGLVDFVVDDRIRSAMAMIEKFQEEASPTYQYYRSSLVTAEKTRKFLMEVDLSERNAKNGNLLYKPKDITSALRDTEGIIQTLGVLREKVEQELFESVKTKGNKLINPLEL